jgi:beta-lactamase class A
VIAQHAYVASTPELLSVAEEIAGHWNSLGIVGQLLARNLDTAEECGFDVHAAAPLCSVAKVPLGLAVLDAIARGELDPALAVTLDPATTSVGPTGVGAFRHPATMAVADLVLQMLTVSDNAAADALLDLLGIEAVNDSLERWRCSGIRVRHRFQRMYECAVDAAGGDFALARDLAIQSEQTGRHTIETLDPAYANIGSPADLVDLLQHVWLDEVAEPAATAELRRLMSMQVFTQRLSSDLRSDAVHVSGKTGTFLHLRHEIGVIESEAGDRVAIAALTRANRRAKIAQDIDLAIGAAGRDAFDALRQTGS